MDARFGKATANWQGNGRGSGTLSTGSGAVTKIGYGSIQNRDSTHTCPDELMAAAQAGCFTLALAKEVSDAGFKARLIETCATFRVEDLAPGWTVTEIFVDTTADVARMTPTEFIDAALRAKERCSITRLYAARIWMQARLKPPLLPRVKKLRRPAIKPGTLTQI